MVIRTSSVTYNLLSAPPPEQGRFDPRHIAVHDLRADIHLPRIANDDFTVDIRRLRLAERSGLQLEVKGHLHADNSRLAAEGVEVAVGKSRLTLAPMTVEISSLKSIGQDLRNARLDLQVLDGSRIYAADMGPFYSPLAASNASVSVTAHITGTPDDLSLNTLTIDGSGLSLEASGSISGLTRGRRHVTGELSHLDLHIAGTELERHIAAIHPLKPGLAALLHEAGDASLQLTGAYAPSGASLSGSFTGAPMQMTFEGTAVGDIPGGRFSVDGRVEVPRADLSASLPARARLGSFSADAQGQITVASGRVSTFDVDAAVRDAIWNGTEWDEITAEAAYDGARLNAELSVNDPEGRARLNASADVTPDFRKFTRMESNLSLDNFNLGSLPVAAPWSRRHISLESRIELSSLAMTDMVGNISINGLTLTGDGATVVPGDITASIDCISTPMELSLRSELADMRASGTFDFPHVAKDVMSLLAEAAPAVFSRQPRTASGTTSKRTHDPTAAVGTNAFSIDLTIKDTRPLEGLFNLPVSVVHPVEIGATINAPGHYMALTLDAPYLLQKEKLIENTALNIGINGIDDRTGLYFTTVYPAKKGPVSLTLDGQGHADAMDLLATWDMTGKQPMSGSLSLSGSTARSDEGS